MANMGIDTDQMDAWLTQVELISDKIKKLKNNEMSIQQFDKLATQKKEKEERLGREKEEKQRKQQEALLQGRYGKGQKENYQSFCKRCFTQYPLKTEMCEKCQIPTMTCKQRREELMGKVKQYQTAKNTRAQRKRKWELWQRTEAMLYKKTSTKYSQWEYFQDSQSEDEDEKNRQPVTPENDPNFKALEMDIKERAKRSEDNRAKAEALKEKGNGQLKMGNFQQAISFYTEALEFQKDIKSIWTNRALAYIRVKRYSKAVEDCTKVLQYSECFEEGYLKSKDFCFKAFVRRSWAKKDLHQFENALKDVEEALKLIPNDVDALNLQSEILEMQQQKLQIRSLNQQMDLQKQGEQQKNTAFKDQQPPVVAMENKENEVPNQNSEQVTQEKPLSKEDKVVSTEGKEEKICSQPQQNQEEEIGQKEGEKQEGDKDKAIQGTNKQELLNSSDLNTEATTESQEDLHLAIQAHIQEYKGMESDFKKMDYIVTKLENKYFVAFFNSELVELFKKSEDLRLYFYKVNGLKKAISLIDDGKNLFLPMQILITDNIFNQREFIRLKGLPALYKYIKAQIVLLEKSKEAFDEMEEALEILIEFTIIEQIRNTLKDDSLLNEALVANFTTIIKHHRNEPSAVSSYCVLFSNLCYSQSPLKQKIRPCLKEILNGIYLVLSHKSGKTKYDYMRENLFNFLANILTESDLRADFLNANGGLIVDSLLDWLVFYDLAQKNNKDNRISDSILSVLVNLTFQLEKTNIANISDQKWQTLLLFKLGRSQKSNPDHKNSINRTLQVLAQLNFAENSDLVEKGLIQEILTNFFDDVSIDSGYFSHAIRLLTNLVTTPQCLAALKKSDLKNFNQLFPGNMRRLINSDDELQFCNSCHLSGLVVDSFPDMLQAFRDIIPRLITVCRDKTGNHRKNAAIFVSQLTKDASNQDIFYQLHGMDVLKSVHHLILEK